MTYFVSICVCIIKNLTEMIQNIPAVDYDCQKKKKSKFWSYMRDFRTNFFIISGNIVKNYVMSYFDSIFVCSLGQTPPRHHSINSWCRLRLPLKSYNLVIYSRFSTQFFHLKKTSCNQIFVIKPPNWMNLKINPSILAQLSGEN